MSVLPPGHNEQQRRYRTDPEFATAVNHMRDLLRQLPSLTTLDLRNAATLASLAWEAEHVQPVYIGPVRL